jgi:hypothetical protein
MPLLLHVWQYCSYLLTDTQQTIQQLCCIVCLTFCSVTASGLNQGSLPSGLSLWTQKTDNGSSSQQQQPVPVKLQLCLLFGAQSVCTQQVHLEQP